MQVHFFYKRGERKKFWLRKKLKWPINWNWSSTWHCVIVTEFQWEMQVCALWIYMVSHTSQKYKSLTSQETFINSLCIMQIEPDKNIWLRKCFWPYITSKWCPSILMAWSFWIPTLPFQNHVMPFLFQTKIPELSPYER